MTRVGLIARCDRGGLANQTWEIWRHIEPERTLLVSLGRAARGAENPGRFDHGDIKTTQGDRIPDDTLRSMAEGLDVLVTVETPYNAAAFDLIRGAGCQSVLVANPELFVNRGADVVVVPTPWSIDRMPPGTEVLPHPVCRDLLPHRRRSEARVFYHPAAPAMLDRNGTKTLLRAMAYIDEPCEVIIRSHERSPWRTDVVTIGHVTARWISAHTEDYWDSYPEEADVIVLPRRYGGLCLPVQEAAALGMPAIMSDLTPQQSWPHVRTIDPGEPRAHRMKGGLFDVWQPDPASLAAAMTDLVRNPDEVGRLSDAANRWADDLSWATQLPRWNDLLR